MDLPNLLIQRPVIVMLCAAFAMTFEACKADPCQQMCTYYYKMYARCELFGQQRNLLPSTCTNSLEDPQRIQQRAEYSTQQCRQDFSYIEGETSRCCSWLCYETLVRAYDRIDGTKERDIEAQRDLCRQFHQLIEEGDAPWCTELQSECLP